MAGESDDAAVPAVPAAVVTVGRPAPRLEWAKYDAALGARFSVFVLDDLFRYAIGGWRSLLVNRRDVFSSMVLAHRAGTEGWPPLVPTSHLTPEPGRAAAGMGKTNQKASTRLPNKKTGHAHAELCRDEQQQPRRQTREMESTDGPGSVCFCRKSLRHLLASLKTALISTAAQTPPRVPKMRFARVSSYFALIPMLSNVLAPPPRH